MLRQDKFAETSPFFRHISVSTISRLQKFGFYCFILFTSVSLGRASSTEVRSETSSGTLIAIHSTRDAIMLDFDGRWTNRNVTGLTFFDCQNASKQQRKMILSSESLIGSRVNIKITAPLKSWWFIRGGILGFPLADAEVEITPSPAKAPFSP